MGEEGIKARFDRRKNQTSRKPWCALKIKRGKVREKKKVGTRQADITRKTETSHFRNVREVAGVGVEIWG